MQVVYELNTSSQWCFDVKWCPRNPALISTCSFDGHVSVYSLMGGTSMPQTSSKVRDDAAACCMAICGHNSLFHLLHRAAGCGCIPVRPVCCASCPAHCPATDVHAYDQEGAQVVATTLRSLFRCQYSFFAV